ncbi:MAG: DUF1573 domain-containing protein [Saprospiraceae bacterium]|nr:DUF1573 domain-containing protein [Saprospiraceae bacterium]MDZ4705593.1 DUF1573 domain-containing protein [Saprospiraceae bacterium]
MFYLLVSISLWWTTPIQPLAPAEEALRIASKVEWLGATEHDFGVLQHRKPSTHEFRFRNTGGEALTVDNVRASCGCTVPEWSYEPVAPDSVGIISVEYDARDLGYFYKKLKVYLHGQRKPELLVIEGEVE